MVSMGFFYCVCGLNSFLAIPYRLGPNNAVLRSCQPRLSDCVSIELSLVFQVSLRCFLGPPVKRSLSFSSPMLFINFSHWYPVFSYQASWNFSAALFPPAYSYDPKM